MSKNVLFFFSSLKQKQIKKIDGCKNIYKPDWWQIDCGTETFNPIKCF